MLQLVVPLKPLKGAPRKPPHPSADHCLLPHCRVDTGTDLRPFCLRWEGTVRSGRWQVRRPGVEKMGVRAGKKSLEGGNMV